MRCYETAIRHLDLVSVESTYRVSPNLRYMHLTPFFQPQSSSYFLGDRDLETVSRPGTQLWQPDLTSTFGYLAKSAGGTSGTLKT